MSQACFNCLCYVFWFSATCGLSGIEIGSLELILWFWIVSWCITWVFGLDDVCFSNLSGWIGGLCAICSLYYYLMISCSFSISYVYLLLELVSLWDYDWFRKLRIDGIKLEMHFPLFQLKVWLLKVKLQQKSIEISFFNQLMGVSFIWES